ncbi:4-alpha-glucanotransferase [bacterium]|nr:4-alpha-glucanotransferase [bacterium]
MSTIRERRAGLLLHPTSLPGQTGIGELGSEAYGVLDWIAQAGFTLWQVLPLGPTGYGDSPYQCFSAFAGNPYLISLERLVGWGWLDEGDIEPIGRLEQERVNYGAVIPLKVEVLDKAFAAWDQKAGSEERGRFDHFYETNRDWLDDYALFSSLKQFHDGKPWNQWPEHHRDRDTFALEEVRRELNDRLRRAQWMQYIFNRQWQDLRAHAADLGLAIMGDMPIFVAYDSADVWANREKFHLDADGNPTVVAGVPPDYFSATGQRWGNPLYRWEVHRDEDFAWWQARIRRALEQFDLIRIDHFRGFAACWEIPADEPTAVNGRWVDAPGDEFFTSLQRSMGSLPLVAEDLGEITSDVIELRKKYGLPGMGILQFAWKGGPSNAFLPHNHERNSVVYTGTHDNNTTLGWWDEEADDDIRKAIADYIGHDVTDPTGDMLRMAFASVADTAVVPMQDVLRLDETAKMNRPGIETGNWSWRVNRDHLTPEIAREMRGMIKRYNRLANGSTSG